VNTTYFETETPFCKQ